MTSKEAREYFENKGLTYEDITAGDICVLVILLNKYIKKARKNNELSVYSMTLSEKIRSKYSRNGGLRSCYLFVNSHYFYRRECISFNEDGFIGFAGWASEINVKPIIDAFIEWCNILSKTKQEELTNERV